jgi:hypothetical protein
MRKRTKLSLASVFINNSSAFISTYNRVSLSFFIVSTLGAREMMRVEKTCKETRSREGHMMMSPWRTATGPEQEFGSGPGAHFLSRQISRDARSFDARSTTTLSSRRVASQLSQRSKRCRTAIQTALVYSPCTHDTKKQKHNAATQSPPTSFIKNEWIHTTKYMLS